jgi:hypothetical protein
MSAPEMALLSREPETSRSPVFLHARWWERLVNRCSSATCPHRGKISSALLHLVEGVEFEGRWYCRVSCLQPSVAFRVQNLLASFRQEKPRVFRLPLGLLLVNRGFLTQTQLRLALQQQREFPRRRIGDWFLELGMITEEQLTQALGQQWGCPVFPLELQPAKVSWGDLPPVPLLESASAVPAYASPDGRLLHLAFAERVDHTFLYAVEQMLGCRTVPCVSSPTAIANLLAHLRRTAAREETSFDTVRDPREMTSTICSYAEELQAAKVSIARSASFIWVRFYRSSSSRDLLFRVLPDPSVSLADRLAFLPKAFSTFADEGKDGVSNAPEPL